MHRGKIEIDKEREGCNAHGPSGTVLYFKPGCEIIGGAGSIYHCISPKLQSSLTVWAPSMPPTVSFCSKEKNHKDHSVN